MKGLHDICLIKMLTDHTDLIEPGSARKDRRTQQHLQETPASPSKRTPFDAVRTEKIKNRIANYMLERSPTSALSNYQLEGRQPMES